MILNYLKLTHRLFNLFLFLNCILSLFTFPLPTFSSFYFIFSLLCFLIIFSISSHCLRIDDIYIILTHHRKYLFSFNLAVTKLNIYNLWRYITQFQFVLMTLMYISHNIRLLFYFFTFIFIPCFLVCISLIRFDYLFLIQFYIIFVLFNRNKYVCL